MPVEFPKGPTTLMAKKGEITPGQGLNISPFEGDLYLDIDTPIGKCSAFYLRFMFQLPKWGFDRVKLDEKIDVSPVFQQYYQLTIKQKQELENMIKAALASISTALSDLEMLKHDLRKYKEFMDYFRMRDVGKKKNDEALMMKGEQSLKAIFIDQVDAHTDLPNTPIALRSIVGRWPTIIADFMRLKDEDTTPEKIKNDYNISEAQAVVLSTKNKLYQEWRDQLFRRTVEERFNSLLQMVEARRKSYEEYKEMIKPTLRRYKSIVDGIGKLGMERMAFWRPESQAVSLDHAIIWAWKPIVAPEKYKAPREAPMDKVSGERAGFTREEVEYIVKNKLKKEKKIKDGETEEEKRTIAEACRDFTVSALPIEPSIDNLVRDNIKKIEIEYNIKISPQDIYNARQKLVTKFEESVRGQTSYEAWAFSPYFIFFDMTINRFVARLPDGSEIEDMMFDRFKVSLSTQNVIILHLIELEAKDKDLDNYIGQLLGEMGKTSEGEVVDIKKLEEDWLINLEGETKKEEKKPIPVLNFFKQVGDSINKFLEFFGIKLSFFRALGPYEFSLNERVSKYYIKEAGITFLSVVNYIKSSFGVP